MVQLQKRPSRKSRPRWRLLLCPHGGIPRHNAGVSGGVTLIWHRFGIDLQIRVTSHGANLSARSAACCCWRSAISPADHPRPSPVSGGVIDEYRGRVRSRNDITAQDINPDADDAGPGVRPQQSRDKRVRYNNHTLNREH